MFVRKRDPRHKNHLVDQARINQTEANISPLSNPTSRTPQTNSTPYVEQEWQKVTQDHQHDDLEWAEGGGGENSEEWECIVCRKSFKSEAAWDSHERSKKHMKEVERLKREIMRENEELVLSGEAWDDADERGRVVEINNNEPPPTPSEQGGDDSDSVSMPFPKTIDVLEDVFVSEESSKHRIQVQVDQTTACDDEAVDKQPPAEASRELSKREKRKLREARKPQAVATERGTAQVCSFICCKSRPDRWLGLQRMQKTFRKSN